MASMKKPSITKQAAALASLETGSQTVEEVAKSVNVSRATIYNWKKQAQTDRALQEAVQMEKSELAGKFFALASGLAERLTGALPDATWENKAVQGLSVAVDKWLALTGQAQTITETRVSGTVNLLVEARQAVDLYRSEGFSEIEAIEALAEDDPELWRALVAEGHQAGPDQ